MSSDVHVDGKAPHGNPDQADLSFGSHRFDELLGQPVDILKDEPRWAAWREEARRDKNGSGFMLGGHLCVCADLDNCFRQDGRLHAWAQAWFRFEAFETQTVFIGKPATDRARAASHRVSAPALSLAWSADYGQA